METFIAALFVITPKLEIPQRFLSDDGVNKQEHTLNRKVVFSNKIKWVTVEDNSTDVSKILYFKWKELYSDSNAMNDFIDVIF